ncbi:MAG: CoA transferase, partial [Betaproteobacteria bacterium]
GPHAHYVAYPLNSYHACAMAQQLPADPLRPQDRERPPLQAGGLWGQAQAGTVAALSALALQLRPDGGEGLVLDCSTQESLISFFWTEVARFPNEGRSPTRLAPMATIVGGILPSRDGFVQVAVREDHQWSALATLLGREAWITDPRFATRLARSQGPADIARLLAEQTCNWGKMDLQNRGRELGIPIAAVMEPAELLQDPDMAHRAAWSEPDATGLRWPSWLSSVMTLPRSALPAGEASAAGRRPPVGHGSGPLAGLRVIDLGWVAMGPYAGYTLAGLGAEVIHVAKPPEGSASGLDTAAYNYGFDTLNTGKTWVGIDLKTPRGRDLLLQLVAQADVVVANFRPGVMARLGLDYEALHAANPRIVLLSASTYGERNIGGSYVGYAPVFSALAGLAHVTGYPDGPPVEVSHPVDFYAGLVGVVGVVAALHRLKTTGTGCHIDLAAREAIAWSLSHSLALAQKQGGQGRWGNGHAAMAPHGVYRCRGDNRWISIAVGDDVQWQRLCACMNNEALAGDAALSQAEGRLAHGARIDAAIGQWTATQDALELTVQLQAGGVAAFASVTGEDLWNDAHLHARGVFAARTVGNAQRWYITPPWRVHGSERTQLETVVGGPAVESVFGRLLGLSPDQISALCAQGVIAQRH